MFLICIFSLSSCSTMAGVIFVILKLYFFSLHPESLIVQSLTTTDEINDIPETKKLECEVFKIASRFFHMSVCPSIYCFICSYIFPF